jgi:uncharacterized membrane protein YjgN (DUF898 family)
LNDLVTPNPFAHPPANPNDSQPALPQLEGGPIRIKFTGDGSEYFKIWITNLLLTIVTFGIYSAWAKVRREKYFRQNTYIGESNLDYHGNPKSILFGRIFALGLLALASASKFSVPLALGAAFVVAIALPWFLRSSIKFKFYNTSYQGLRFGFHGTVGKAYLIALPLAVAGIGVTLLPKILEDAKGLSPMFTWLGSLVGVAILILIAYGPVFNALWRKFAINHAHYGTVLTSTKMTVGGYIWTYSKTALIPLLVAIGLVALIWFTGMIGVLTGGVGNRGTAVFLMVFLGIAVLALYPLVLLLGPIIAARIQNYVWNEKTFITDANQTVLATFYSNLRGRDYLKLQIKNYILLSLTAGLYRPFMAINNAKAKLEAISISDLSFIDTVRAQKQAGNRAFGAEAVDAFDLDLSL